MKVMVMVKANADSEAGVMPGAELLTEMGKYNQQLVEAGLMLAGEGLHPSKRGVRVRFSGKDRAVTDGPFAGTKELLAGYWLWRVESMDEAIEWVKRCPSPMPGESEIEIRPVFELDDFAESDPTGELRAAEQRLRERVEAPDGPTTFATPSDRAVVITRAFDAPRQRVWDAWTKPEHLPHWMVGRGDWTMTACDVDLRPGGAWRFAWKHDHCGEMAMGGQYREVAPPGRLVSTESWGGDWPETLNTLSLADDGARTVVTKTILYPTAEARAAAFGTGMRDGISHNLNRLAEYLTTQP